MIGLLTRILGGGLLDRLAEAYKSRSDATTAQAKIEAEREIARLEHRLATSDNRGLALAIGTIALAIAVHFAAVVFVSTFPQVGWTVHALPAPMNEWEAQIILGFFGLAAVARIFRR